MNTFGNIIAAKEREGEARGLELGEARGLELGEARGLELGKKKILVQFVAEFWGRRRGGTVRSGQLDQRGPQPIPHDRQLGAGTRPQDASPA